VGVRFGAIGNERLASQDHREDDFQELKESEMTQMAEEKSLTLFGTP
jgi:hypothetical protein